MELTIKYQNRVIAKEFGQYTLSEVVVLPDTAKYVDILNLLKEKYITTGLKKESNRKREELENIFVNNFIIHCNKGIVRNTEDQLIEAEELMVLRIYAGG